MVTALVGENPETSSEQTLDDGVECPQRSANWCGRNGFGGDESVEEEECGCKTGDIPSHVAQPPQTRSLETTLWNSISNVVDGEVWQLEFVSVGVEELSVSLLVHFPQRGHGRERSRGGRLSGGVTWGPSSRGRSRVFGGRGDRPLKDGTLGYRGRGHCEKGVCILCLGCGRRNGSRNGSNQSSK